MGRATWEKVIKIVVTVIGFFGSFFLISLVAYLLDVKLLNDASCLYDEYLLYLLGYGELCCVNGCFKVIFSIVSLTVLALFSSVCTVGLFELRSKLKIDNRIAIKKNKYGDFTATVKLKNRQKDVYGAKICMIVTIDNKTFSDETQIAYIPKKKFGDAVFTVGLNSVMYKHFKEHLTKNTANSQLVITATYTDIISGKEYTICKKYSCKNAKDFIFLEDCNLPVPKKMVSNESARAEFNEFINQNQFHVDFSRAKIVNSKEPDKGPTDSSNIFCEEFNPKSSYTDGDFQMLCIPIPANENWGVYHDLNCLLNIDVYVINDIEINLEIKRDDGRTIQIDDIPRLFKGLHSINIDLSQYRRHNWENVKEICFTVFYQNVKSTDKTAHFFVKECAFVLPKSE